MHMQGQELLKEARATLAKCMLGGGRLGDRGTGHNSAGGGGSLVEAKELGLNPSSSPY